ncbi:MAG: fimbrillin family protein, partial [Candidatus Cryptobacteroides sp.]
FTRLGNTSYLSYEWNVSGSFDKGWHFRTVLKDESGGETIFFPALGCRLYNDGVLYNVGSDCYYWSSLPCGVNFGCDMKYELGYVSPLSFSNRSIGFVVRPVRE